MQPTPIDDQIPRLYAFLRSRYPRLQSDHDDIIQDVRLGVLKRLSNEPGFEPTCRWSTYLIRAVINATNRVLRNYERTWFITLADEDDVAADSHPDPANILIEAERRERQTLLLSDILREYVTQCEEGSRHVQKEVYERRWRGQSPSQIAKEMRLKEDNVNQNVNRARNWVRERIQQADVAQSVFLTLLNLRRDVPAPSSLPPGVPTNFNEVMERLIHEAGVLCPSEASLNLYLGRPTDPALSDVRFHVEGAQCPLCLARSGSFPED